MRNVVAATLLLLTMMATMARADTITFKLNQANVAFTGPYAQVTIDLTSSTTALVTFDSLFGGGDEYLFGGAGAVALNIDATSFTVANFTGSNNGLGFSNTVGDLSQGAAGNEDGFGSFNLTVDSFDGYSHSWSNIGFLLTNTGGTWANASSVLTANNANQVAAAHIFACMQFPTFCTQAEGAIGTGFASGFLQDRGGPPPPPPPTVPEPTTLVLLGSGLAMAGLRKYGKGKA